MNEKIRSTPRKRSDYQVRIEAFMLACFGREIADDVRERNHRFIEESLELVQANGCSAAEAHMLVDYVFGRPTGQAHQEAGGVMVTLAALCNAAQLDAEQAGEDELARVWGKLDVIREKQKNKPRGSSLPQAIASETKDREQRMPNLLDRHPSEDVRAAAIRLLDTLTSWERSTGRKNLVIVKDGIGCELRSLCNGPIPATVTDAEALEAYRNMP